MSKKDGLGAMRIVEDGSTTGVQAFLESQDTPLSLYATSVSLVLSFSSLIQVSYLML